jgi:hypothetical protein
MVNTGHLYNLGAKEHDANVVGKLVDRKLSVGHTCYVDNFYNSRDLALHL